MSLVDHIKEFSKIKFNSINENFNEIEIEVSKDKLFETMLILKDDPICFFEQLTDITAVDYPQKKERFLLIYQLLSISNNNRIRVLCYVSEDDTIPTISKIYPSAIWAERELWDMFGIFVNDHPDLRRLLTDYGFQGHPLRKDFPLTGHTEVGYDLENRRVVYTPVELVQDFREFDFDSPWGVFDKNSDIEKKTKK